MPQFKPNVKKIIRFKLKLCVSKDGEKICCILKENDTLGYGAYITLYRKIGDMGKYFATGKVANIQTNKLIRVDLLHFDNDGSAISSAVNNDLLFIESLIAKTIVTDKYMEEVR